ncbi:MAG: hypothetical protein U0P30_00130 [Vicinamibacterales bacterium]
MRGRSAASAGDRTPADAPATASYKVPKLLEQDVPGDDQPFGSRGGVAVRHLFPVAGDYGAARVRLRRQVYDYIIGMGHPQALDLRTASTASACSASTVGGGATGMPGPLTWNGEITGETPHGFCACTPRTTALRSARASRPARTRCRRRLRRHAVEFEGIQPMPVDFARGADERSSRASPPSTR